MLQSPVRIPKPMDDQGFLACKADSFQNNNTGLCIRVLIDLQKLFGCLVVVDAETRGFDSYSPSEKNDMKLRVADSDKYSPRLNLVFRSNMALKTLTSIAQVFGFFFSPVTCICI